MNERYKKFITTRVLPYPSSVTVADGFFQLKNPCDFMVSAPLPDEELQAIVHHVAKTFWECTPRLTTANDRNAEIIADGYDLDVQPQRVTIRASGYNGLLNAFKTLRQIAEPERGVLKFSYWNVPCVQITDRPRFPFRGIHFCWFPETPEWEMEKQIRIAAYLKFNYAVIESWGVLRFKSHPELCWDEYAIAPETITRLVRLGRSLGIKLIPQFNILGHGALSRTGGGKHALLNRHPEYSSLFEPDGWAWCIGNPATRHYLTDLVLELHELFEQPDFFHVGCDEAHNAGSCAICSENFPEKLCTHLMYFHNLLQERQTRIMMWHDQLVERNDPRWAGFLALGEHDFKDLYRTLPKDVVICDWQYAYSAPDGREPQWATAKFFKANGFDTLFCPWHNLEGIISQGKMADREALFGTLMTTWHLNHGHYRDNIWMGGANAAWSPDIPTPPGVVGREYLNRCIRQVDADMHCTEYMKFGKNMQQIVFPSFQV